uniref:Uncharacterized protein n=1 Tax=Oryza punctata TaxID=4537 RepID=A0A0E0M0F4_ORYPU
MAHQVIVSPLDRACLEEGAAAALRRRWLRSTRPSAAVHRWRTPRRRREAWPQKERMVSEEESAGEPCSVMHESQLLLTFAAFRGRCSPAAAC